MTYVIEKKTRNSKVKRALKKKARERSVSFDQSFKLRRQPEDRLKERDRQKKASVEFHRDRKNPNPLTTLQRIKGARETVKRHGGDRPLKMTTPKAREKERAYQQGEGFIYVSDLMSLHEETSELEKRCIADVMAKGAKGSENTLSRAYAICRASLQKSGRIKKGTAELTKKGGKISGTKAKKDDHDAKVSRFEKHVVAARKK